MRILRTSQPQSPVAIDWSHPATKGLTLLVNPAVGLTDLVRGINPAAVDTNITRGTIGKGKAVVSNGLQNAELAWYGTPGTSGANAVTACVQFRLNALAGKPLCVWGTVASWLIEIQSDGDILYALFPTSGIVVNTTTNQPLVAGKTHTVVLRWAAGQVVRIWLDGVEQPTGGGGDASASDVLPTGGFQTLLNSHAESSQIDGGISFAAVSKRAWHPDVCRSMSANPWQIFESRRYAAVNSIAGGDVTLALSGQAATLSAGTLAPSTSKALTSQALSAATGTLIPATSIALSGQALTGSLGTLVPNLAKAITGQSLTASLGTIVPATGLTLTGQSLSSAQGTLSPAASVALSGGLITFGQGTIAPEGDVIVALTGQALSLATGTLTPSSAKALSGAALTSAQGTAVPTLALAISGQSITTAQGTLTFVGDVTVALSGQAMTIAQGSFVVEGANRSSTGAGSRTRRRRRYYVEIDGQDFEVSSAAEAQTLLARARTVTETAIEKARASTRVNPGIARPRIRTRDPELKQVVAQAQAEITTLYDSALRDLEIRALMAKADEEEEALIRLLM